MPRPDAQFPEYDLTLGERKLVRAFNAVTHQWVWCYTREILAPPVHGKTMEQLQEEERKVIEPPIDLKRRNGHWEHDVAVIEFVQQRNAVRVRDIIKRFGLYQVTVFRIIRDHPEELAIVGDNRLKLVVYRNEDGTLAPHEFPYDPPVWIRNLVRQYKTAKAGHIAQTVNMTVDDMLAVAKTIPEIEIVPNSVGYRLYWKP